MTPVTTRRRRPSEAGTTLIELLVAVAIMGVAFVVVIGGIGTAIIGASSQKQQASANVVLRTAAETITYQPCAELATYAPPSPHAPVSTAGFAVSVTDVRRWRVDTNEFELPGPGCAPENDTGLALIELTVTSTDGQQPTTQTLQVVKYQL